MKTSKQWSEKRKTVLGITLTFPSMEDKQRAVEFLNSGGRKQASYMLYLLDEAMEKAGAKKVVIGEPIDYRL